MKTNITLKNRIFNLRSFFSYGGGGWGGVGVGGLGLDRVRSSQPGKQISWFAHGLDVDP